jgi:general secretion pathway protein G
MKTILQMRHRDRRRGSQKGFTLIEVLLVLVILVILGGIAVPMFVGIGEQARKDAAQVQVNALESAINNYQATVGLFPTSLDELITQPGDPKLSRRWAGPYLESNKSLVDPWQNPYQYSSKGTRNKGGYDVWSMGPDAQNNTEDDIGNWPIEG